MVGALIETILPEMNCRFIALPDPETVSIVKRIFHMRCMGNSFRSIAAALNQEGIPSPRTLYYQQLKKKTFFFKKWLTFFESLSIIHFVRGSQEHSNMVPWSSG